MPCPAKGWLRHEPLTLAAAVQPACGTLAQALWQVFAARPSTLPAACAAGCASTLFLAKRLGRLPAALEPLSRNLLGWTATLLFMFQPLAQLVRHLRTPAHGPPRHSVAHSCLPGLQAVLAGLRDGAQL